MQCDKSRFFTLLVNDLGARYGGKSVGNFGAERHFLHET
jgi:hypothetical protein